MFNLKYTDLKKYRTPKPSKAQFMSALRKVKTLINREIDKTKWDGDKTLLKKSLKVRIQGTSIQVVWYDQTLVTKYEKKEEDFNEKRRFVNPTRDITNKQRKVRDVKRDKEDRDRSKFVKNGKNLPLYEKNRMNRLDKQAKEQELRVKRKSSGSRVKATRWGTGKIQLKSSGKVNRWGTSSAKGKAIDTKVKEIRWGTRSVGRIIKQDTGKKAKKWGIRAGKAFKDIPDEGKSLKWGLRGGKTFRDVINRDVKADKWGTGSSSKEEKDTYRTEELKSFDLKPIIDKVLTKILVDFYKDFYGADMLKE